MNKYGPIIIIIPIDGSNIEAKPIPFVIEYDYKDKYRYIDIGGQNKVEDRLYLL